MVWACVLGHSRSSFWAVEAKSSCLSTERFKRTLQGAHLSCLSPGKVQGAKHGPSFGTQSFARNNHNHVLTKPHKASGAIACQSICKFLLFVHTWEPSLLHICHAFLWLQGLEIVAALRLFGSRATGLVSRMTRPLQQLAEQLTPALQLVSELQEQHHGAAAAAAAVHDSQAKHAAAQVSFRRYNDAPDIYTCGIISLCCGCSSLARVTRQERYSTG